MSVRVCDTHSHFPQTRKMSFTFENPHWCVYTYDYKIFNWNHFTGFFSLLSCDSSTEQTFCNDLFEYCTADIYMALCIQMTFYTYACNAARCRWDSVLNRICLVKNENGTRLTARQFSIPIEIRTQCILSQILSYQMDLTAKIKWIEQVEKNNMKSETEYERSLLKNRNFSSLHLHLNSSANAVATRCLAGEKVAFYWTIVHFLNDMAE